jgi:hypothetical protein
MKDPTYCMDALRHLSTDATLDVASQLLAAERAINNYYRAGANSIEQRGMLIALGNEIARVALIKGDDFWPAVRDIIAQLVNQLPDQD